MPSQLVDRINASLAAEQVQRAARTRSTTPSTTVTPLVASARKRRVGRLSFGIAGAAAAIALFAAVGSGIFNPSQQTTTAARSVASSSAGGNAASRSEADGAQAPDAPSKAEAFAGPGAAPTMFEIGHSGTRYTKADFVSQVRTLQHTRLAPNSAKPSRVVGPAVTAAGLKDCLVAIGASPAQSVRADVASYQGQPAVVIVVTTNHVPLAYAVGPQCSATEPALLRPATALS
jgi:hypothetical protein